MKRRPSDYLFVGHPEQIDDELSAINAVVKQARSSTRFNEQQFLQACNTRDLESKYKYVLRSIANTYFNEHLRPTSSVSEPISSTSDVEVSCPDIVTELLNKNIAPKIIELVYRFMITWLPLDEPYDMCGMEMEGITSVPHTSAYIPHPHTISKRPPVPCMYFCICQLSGFAERILSYCLVFLCG